MMEQTGATGETWRLYDDSKFRDDGVWGPWWILTYEYEGEQEEVCDTYESGKEAAYDFMLNLNEGGE